tara:strand:- start:27132 stop:28019 length:888 start_codon:yes stop_codon:yes gene_type:complete
METIPFTELRIFTVVVELNSFRRAADRLGLDPSTVSHTIKALEAKLGVRLFQRTTRRVSPTAAATDLYAEIKPAFSAVASALENLNEVRQTPRGHLRIASSHSSYLAVLRPMMASFSVAFPDIVLEIAVNEGFVDLVSDGLDAGLRMGHSIDKDMIAVRATPDQRHAIVCSPKYLTNRPRPLTPHDLNSHACIQYRNVSAQRIATWHFEKGAEVLEIKVAGPLIFDTPPLMLDAAVDGLGFASVLEPVAKPLLDAGRLVRVLEDWCPPLPGFYLYYPSRRHMTAALRAFVDAVKI